MFSSLKRTSAEIRIPPENRRFGSLAGVATPGLPYAVPHEYSHRRHDAADRKVVFHRAAMTCFGRGFPRLRFAAPPAPESARWKGPAAFWASLLRGSSRFNKQVVGEAAAAAPAYQNAVLPAFTGGRSRRLGSVESGTVLKPGCFPGRGADSGSERTRCAT